MYSTHFWEGSKSQYRHYFFLPQMIHYMTADQEPGVQWSPMPLHMHTSIVQLPPLHRIQEICMCRAVLRPWCQRWLNPDNCDSIPYLGEWGISFHAFINILFLLDQGIQPGCFSDFTQNIFTNTIALFKRSVNFLLLQNPLDLNASMCLVLPLWGRV